MRTMAEPFGSTVADSTYGVTRGLWLTRDRRRREQTVASRVLAVTGDNVRMRISARADYAVRAVVALARQEDGSPMSADAVARDRDIPYRFLESILVDLRRAGVVVSRRGASGGYVLARPADVISVADVMRAVDGPLVYVRDARPSEIADADDAQDAIMVEMWVALRASVRNVLETTTVSDIASGRLPEGVRKLADAPESWRNASLFGD